MKAYNLERKAQLSQFLRVDFGEVTGSISCLYNNNEKHGGSIPWARILHWRKKGRKWALSFPIAGST